MIKDKTIKGKTIYNSKQTPKLFMNDLTSK